MSSSPGHRDLPVPALTSIGYYLGPHQLVRLSGVNKNWYSAMTSDDVWASWDVYGVKSDVYGHYIRSKPDFTEEEWNQMYSREASDEFKNCYYLLWQARTSYPGPAGEPLMSFRDAPVSALWCLTQRPLRQGVLNFNSVPRRVSDNPTLVYSLLRAGVGPEGLVDDYRTDPGAALASLSARSTVQVLRSVGEPQVESYFDMDYIYSQPEFLRASVENGLVWLFELPEELIDAALEDAQMDGIVAKRAEIDFFMDHYEFPEEVDMWVYFYNIFQNPINAQKLLKVFPRMLPLYTAQCDGNSDLIADRDLVLRTLDVYPKHKDSYEPAVLQPIPNKLLSEKTFVSQLLSTCKCSVDWSHLPVYLRYDRDVLCAMALRIKQQVRDLVEAEQDDFYQTYVLPEHEQCHDWIVALVTCKYALDLPAEVETLQRIMSLKEVSKIADLLSSEGFYIKTELLAEILFEEVGLNYAERRSAVNKKQRLG